MIRSRRTVAALLGAVLLALGLFGFGNQSASAHGQPALTTTTASTAKPIAAKALCDHETSDTEWHFVITQTNSAQAPPSIHVTWTGGVSADVPLNQVTGGTAHYSTTLHLDLDVDSATAVISGVWSGQFNLSHGPACHCDQTTTTTTTVITTTTVPVTTTTVPGTTTSPATTISETSTTKPATTTTEAPTTTTTVPETTTTPEPTSTTAPTPSTTTTAPSSTTTSTTGATTTTSAAAVVDGGAISITRLPVTGSDLVIPLGIIGTAMLLAGLATIYIAKYLRK